MAVAPGSTSKTHQVRVNEEHACLASGYVNANRFVQPRSSLGGPESRCGALRPFVVSAVDDGRVKLSPSATLRCGMIPAVDAWVKRSVAPAALQYLGSPIVSLKVLASYSCRTRNGLFGAKLSEHGLANAIDIGAFDLADGRRITVRRGWRGNSSERAFLRAVHRDACRYFTTVLGPAADKYHQDHFHFDLARHGRKGTNHYCR